MNYVNFDFLYIKSFSDIFIKVVLHCRSLQKHVPRFHLEQKVSLAGLLKLNKNINFSTFVSRNENVFRFISQILNCGNKNYTFIKFMYFFSIHFSLSLSFFLNGIENLFILPIQIFLS